MRSRHCTRQAAGSPPPGRQTTISFPSEIRDDAVQTTGNPRIEAGWIEGGLTKADHARDGKLRRGRLPVGVVTVFIEDGQTKTDRAIYQLGYSSHPRVLRSDRVELEGLSLSRRGVGEDVQAAVPLPLAFDRFPTVRMQNLPGHVGRIFAGEEKISRGHFIGLTGAAKRNVLAEFRNIFRIEARVRKDGCSSVADIETQPAPVRGAGCTLRPNADY